MNAYWKFRCAGVLNSVVYLWAGCALWELIAYSKETKKIIYMGFLYVVLLVAAAFTEGLRDSAKAKYDREKT